MKNYYSKYIAEFRFLPIAPFLDVRGGVVEKMLGGYLDEWIVDGNRVDVINTKARAAVFVSIHNSGFATEDKSDFNLIFKTLEDGLSILPETKFTRLGFRQITIMNYEKEFKDLVELFESKTLGKLPKSIKESSIELEDLALVFNFIGEGFGLNAQVGPMKKEQAKNIFSDKSKVFNNSIFIDSDYFINKPQVSNFKTVKKFVKDGLNFTDEFNSKINEIIQDMESK